MKFYEYAKCSTCVKAGKFLEKAGAKFERIPIVDTPPSMRELKQMLAYVKEAGGSIRSLFNSSGQMYRELGISEKLKAGMTEAEALKLLSENGKLIKRPFVLTARSGLVGFNPEEWKKFEIS